MTYYKVVQNGTVIDAGYVFLKWNEKHKRLFACDIDEAQLVQSYDQTRAYHADWLLNVPSDAGQFEDAQITVIDDDEFDEIRALLDGGETIDDDSADETRNEEENEPTIEAASEETERPMTIAQMREKITNQQEQIDMLTDCLLEMSEIVYGE